MWRDRVGITGVVLFASLFTTVSIVGQSQAALQPDPATNPGPTEAYTFHDGLTYETVDGEAQIGDLYMPKGAGPFPAIVFIHGGAWHDGTRKQLRGQAALMAESGFVGLAIDYRLSPANRFPAAVEDGKAAVIYLRKHAKELHIDPDRIAAVGSSAGGHLAAMMGVLSTPLTPGETHRAPTDASVQAVASFNGIFDLATMPLSQKTTDFLGNTCAALPVACKDASPEQHVHSGLPPFLLLHGTADQTAPYAQAKAFQEALLVARDTVVLFTAKDAPHTFWAQAKWRESSFNAMREFLMKSLK